MKQMIFGLVFSVIFFISCGNEEIDEITPETPPQNAVGFTLQNAGQAYGKDLVADNNGDFYYTSLFQGEIADKSMTSTGVIDNYFAKHDAQGELIWERSFGGAGSITVAHGIEIDASQNVYLTGYFGSEAAQTGITISMGGNVNITSESGYDAFVCKYDASGTPLWGFHLGNNTAVSEERAWDMAVDANGEIYVAGAFSGTVDFNPLGNVANELSAQGIAHFIAKYDTDGQNIWAKVLEANIGNIFTEGYTTLDLDAAGNVFLAGVFRESLTLGNSNLTSRGITDMFLTSLDAADGSVNWARSFGGAGMDIVSPGAMRVNSLGEPHLTGRFSGTSDFGGTIISSGSPGNTFVLACSASGETKWALAHQSSTGLDGGHRVAFNDQNDVYVAGWFRGTAAFDQAASVSLTSNGTDNASDVFLAKYTPSGALEWAKGFGAAVSGGENLSICAGLGVDGEGNAIITGKFYGSNADYDPSSETELMFSSNGMDDCFVAKYTGEGELFRY